MGMMANTFLADKSDIATYFFFPWNDIICITKYMKKRNLGICKGF